MYKFFFVILLLIFTPVIYADSVQWISVSNSVISEENAPVKTEYFFRNISKNTISISNVKTSCGCTIATYNIGEKIPPNETGKVELNITTVGKPAEFLSSAVVAFDKISMPYLLTCKIHIKGNVTISPQILSWTYQDNRNEKTIMVSSDLEDGPLLINNITISNENYILKTDMIKENKWNLNIKPKTGKTNIAILDILYNNNGKDKHYFAILKTQ